MKGKNTNTYTKLSSTTTLTVRCSSPTTNISSMWTQTTQRSGSPPFSWEKWWTRGWCAINKNANRDSISMSTLQKTSRGWPLEARLLLPGASKSMYDNANQIGSPSPHGQITERNGQDYAGLRSKLKLHIPATREQACSLLTQKGRALSIDNSRRKTRGPWGRIDTKRVVGCPTHDRAVYWTDFTRYSEH